MKSNNVKENIFIILSITFLSGLTIFYGYRLFFYYKIEHPKKNPVLSLFDNLVLNESIIKENNLYRFVGNIKNNYIKYSGNLYRIISFDSNEIKLISDDILSTLAWGESNNIFSKSYIYDWLNKSNEFTGIYSETLNNSKAYMINHLSNDNVFYEASLLTYDEYVLAGGKDSYLNNNFYWWLLNDEVEDKIYYIDVNGNLDFINIQNDNYYSFGVRPVIKIKADLNVLKGDGKKDNPYIFESETINVLMYKNVGDYVKYSDYNWRIVSKDQYSIKMAMNGYLTVDNLEMLKDYSSDSNTFDIYDKNSLAYYLNNDFYNKIDSKYIIDSTFYTGGYGIDNKYNYKNIYSKSVVCKVGLLNVGSLYTSNFEDTFLITPSTISNSIFKTTSSGRIYIESIQNKNKIRPVISILNDVEIISGNGNKDNPYIVF